MREVMSSIYITNFPDEILLQIFSHLSAKDLVSASRVNRRWRDLCKDKTLWRDSDYTVSENDTDGEALSCVTSMPRLRVLRLHCMVPSDLLQQMFRTCHRLTELEIDWRDNLLPSDVSCLIENCPNIERLVVPGQRITGVHLELIGRMQNLKSLRFEYRTLSQQPFRLQQLARGCPKLQHLEIPLQFCSGDELERFLAAKAGQLEGLELRWMTFDSGCVLPIVASVCATSMKRLTLGWYDVPCDSIETDLFALCDLVNLEVLAVPYAFRLPPGVLAQVFSGGAIWKLTKLDLRSTGLAVDDEALAAICESCPDLRELLLSGCSRITDVGLQQLGTKVQALDLSNCNSLGGKAITAIARCCPDLRSLKLQCLELIRLQPGLHDILELSKLETLDLTKSKWSVMPLSLFPKRLRYLRELKLQSEKGIAVCVLESLRTLMPQLKIIIGDVKEPEDL